MSDVVSQLEAVIAGIKSRTKHGPGCEYVHGGMCASCDCDWVERVDAGIARTVERMVNAAMEAYQSASFANQMAFMDGDDDKQQDTDAIGWAAAFRAIQEQETQK